MAIPPPGPVICTVKDVAPDDVHCLTHGLRFTGLEAVEQFKKHRDEELVKWHEQQPRLGPEAYGLQPPAVHIEEKKEDLREIMQKDPRRGFQEIAKLVGEQMKSWPSPPSPPQPLFHVQYILRFQWGDELRVNYQARDLEELLKKWDEITEAVRGHGPDHRSK